MSFVFPQGRWWCKEFIELGRTATEIISKSKQGQMIIYGKCSVTQDEHITDMVITGSGGMKSE